MLVSLRPSFTLGLLLTAMHALALFVIFIIPLLWLLKIVITLSIALSLVFYLRRYAFLLDTWAPQAFEIKTDCTCAVGYGEGVWLPARLLPSSFISRHMVILNLAFLTRTRGTSIVILPDTISVAQFRELRVLLKWKCGKLARQAQRPGEHQQKPF